MKSMLLAFAAILICATPAISQEKPAATNEKSKPTPTTEQLESTFKTMLTKATLTGRWCSLKDGELGPEKEDKYNIVSATKAGEHKWIISTRIKMKDREMVVPIPVEVKWAGDTAVLIVDNLQYPGGGTYSARVLFHNNTYAGTWSGGDHGGLMSGMITNQKD
jgi:hypothetical protein